jgi:Uma2 family endonuclease
VATPWQAPELRRFTRDEFYRMHDAGLFRDERVELLDGEIIATGSQNSPHASTIARITNLLIPLIGRKLSVRVQLPVHLERWSEPLPDFAVCVHDPDDYASGHPQPPSILLLIEVADASLAFDRKRKRAAYARAGVPEYWIVNVPDRCVEVSSRPDRSAKRYRVARRARRGDSLILPDGSTVAVTDLVPRG